MSPGPTLVTGASGFVGSAVVRALLSQGHEVRALVRASSDRGNLEGLAVELRTGDLRDPASLRNAAEGCRFVFHVAAVYRLWHPHPREILESNVEGTRNVLRAARDASVERMVYTSSVATLGHREDGRPSGEETPVTLDEMIGPYKRSKFLAEQVVRDFFRKEGFPVVIVHPSAPVGPRDRKPTPTGRLILDAAAGRMPAYVDTGLNVVHVDDVAAGHLLALEKGTPGRGYILGGENLTLKEILTRVAALTGRRPPRIRLSPGLVLPLAWLAQGWARVTGGGEPRITVDGVRLARKTMFFSCERARAELGFRPRPAQDALRDAVDWYRGQGLLPRSRAERGGI